MFSKLIKIISAASLFLVLGSFVFATPVTEARTAQECTANGGTVVTNANGGASCSTGTAGAGNAKNIPGSTVLCGSGGCPIVGNTGASALASRDGIVGLIIKVAQFLSFISVGVAVLVIVYGGYLYLNPTDAKGAEKGKTTLVNAAIGLAIALTAATIVTIVSGLLTGSYF